MKQIAQTLFVLGGGLGFLGSTPLSAYTLIRHRELQGPLSLRDTAIVISPLLCLVLLLCGILWMRREKADRPTGLKRRLMDDGCVGDGGAGGD
jgi:hypothetical protein